MPHALSPQSRANGFFCGAVTLASARVRDGIRPGFGPSSAGAYLRLWLSLTDSMNSGGFFRTHATKDRIAGCSSKDSTVLYFRASSASLNNACSCRWHMRCSAWVSRPPLSRGTRWCWSSCEGGIGRPQSGQVSQFSRLVSDVIPALSREKSQTLGLAR